MDYYYAVTLYHFKVLVTLYAMFFYFLFFLSFRFIQHPSPVSSQSPSGITETTRTFIRYILVSDYLQHNSDECLLV